jgi:hypothetical protein
MIFMETYFDCPKQVMFADPDNPGEWIVGIAYKDEIICACCGGIFDIDNVIEQARVDGVKQAIYPYEDWIDIAYEITGGNFPKGLSTENGKIIEAEVKDDEENLAYDAYYFRNLE